MKRTSKVEQSHIESSTTAFISQPMHIATDSHRLGDATTIRDHKTTEIRWLGDPFAVFHFRYRSRSKFALELNECITYSIRGLASSLPHSEKS